MERKLAHIETISEILPHNNADSLEIAKVLGWTLCVLKGQFQAGQQVVFIEPDAVLKEGKPEWEFMRDRGFRVKTIRLRKIISQGLVFPLSILPLPTYGSESVLSTSSDITISIREVSGYFVGQDVTEILGIIKYEPYIPAQLAGQVKGNFPEFLHKTDEIRIQAVPAILERHKNKKFYVTEKVDGSSMTVYLNNGEFGICSRNLELKETEGNSYWKVARELDLEKKMNERSCSSIGEPLSNFALQGELVGQGIQGNKYKHSNLHFYVFNIFDIDKRQYLCYNEIGELMSQLGIEFVPIVSRDFILSGTVDELVEFSKGKSLLNKDVHREGLVFRPLVEEYDEDLGRLSFKVINPDFLLKYDD